MSEPLENALTPEEWAETRFVPIEHPDVVVHDDGDGLEIVIYPDAYTQTVRGEVEDKYKMRFPSDMVGIMAVANASLPDDSPYKITRADVEEIRAAPNRILWNLMAIADKLEALLPPEAK